MDYNFADKPDFKVFIKPRTTMTGEKFCRQPDKLEYLSTLYGLVSQGWPLQVKVQDLDITDSVVSSQQMEEIEKLPVLPGLPWYKEFDNSKEPTDREIQLMLLDLKYFRAKHGYEVDICGLLPPSASDNTHLNDAALAKLQKTYNASNLRAPSAPTQEQLDTWKRFDEWSDRKMDKERRAQRQKRQKKMAKRVLENILVFLSNII